MLYTRKLSSDSLLHNTANHKRNGLERFCLSCLRLEERKAIWCTEKEMKETEAWKLGNSRKSPQTKWGSRIRQSGATVKLFARMNRDEGFYFGRVKTCCFWVYLLPRSAFFSLLSKLTSKQEKAGKSTNVFWDLLHLFKWPSEQNQNIRGASPRTSWRQGGPGDSGVGFGNLWKWSCPLLPLVMEEVSQRSSIPSLFPHKLWCVRANKWSVDNAHTQTPTPNFADSMKPKERVGVETSQDASSVCSPLQRFCGSMCFSFPPV